MKQKELDAMLDELVKDRSPEEILGEAGLVKQLTKLRRRGALLKSTRFGNR